MGACVMGQMKVSGTLESWSIFRANVVVVVTLWCSTRFGLLLGLAGEAVFQPERLKHGLVAGNVVETIELVLGEHFFRS